MKHTRRILCASGCILLLATAMLHAEGYAPALAAMAASSVPPFFKAALPRMWLHFSIHLVILVFFGVLTLFSSRGARPMLSLLALAVAADAAFVFSLAGFFAGVALLIAAALCFALAAIQHGAPAPAPHDGV